MFKLSLSNELYEIWENNDECNNCVFYKKHLRGETCKTLIINEYIEKYHIKKEKMFDFIDECKDERISIPGCASLKEITSWMTKLDKIKIIKKTENII